MKLTNLEIKDLHGCYNYLVKFNDDITFIYGKNGCGKTTILNITEAIITGKLFNLFIFDFNFIKLSYINASRSEKFEKQLEIYKKYKDENNINSYLTIFFDNKQYIIQSDEINEEATSYEKETRAAHKYYYLKHRFLLKIKEIFNYVYLPLSRLSSQQNIEYEYESEIFHKKIFHQRSFFKKSNNIKIPTSSSMNQVEELIYINQSKTNSTIAKYNDKFRNDLLNSFIEFQNINSIEDFFKDNKEINKDLENTKDSYISILQELNLLDDERLQRLNERMKNIISLLSNMQKLNPSDTINMITHVKDFLKIKEILALAKKMEHRKSNTKKPIELFLRTMNDFISDNDEKKIEIDEIGDVYFTTKHDKRPRNINFLSSGEKQLITFFANLIFNVKSTESGIFVVDEPELSLHLSWQKKFVEKAHEINPRIQFIFATHSPEIVSKYRNRMYKLEKVYSKKGAENG